MLRCGRCGSTKFIFTTAGDAWGEHHGAICATCHKPLNARDMRTNPLSFSAAWPAETEQKTLFRLSGKS